jgi:hypothetical protein
MTCRCLLSTSSYLRTFLRISAFCASIWVWALLICRVTIFDSMGTSSGMLKRSMTASTAPARNRRISSSCSER